MAAARREMRIERRDDVGGKLLFECDIQYLIFDLRLAGLHYV